MKYVYLTLITFLCFSLIAMNTPKVHLTTTDLILREWDIEKDAPYEFMMKQNGMEELYIHPILSLEQVKEAMTERQKHFIKYGYGIYALELKKSGSVIGLGRFRVSPFTSGPLSNCIEAGAHLYAAYTNKGYGTQVAQALLKHGFNALHFQKIVACVHPHNTISKHLMEKMGMTLTVESFAHPNMPEDHPLSICQLYEITKEQWKEPYHTTARQDTPL